MTWLRTDPVSLDKYLPHFLKNDQELQGVLEVESQEHDRQRIAIQDLLEQLFIDTATWGLADYERVLDIHPGKSDTFAQRRNKILLKLQGKQVSSVAFMENLARRYMTPGTQVRIEEDNKNNRFRLYESDGRILYPTDLVNALDTYKPAHLAINIVLKRLLELKDDEKIKVAVVSARTGTHSVHLNRLENQEVSVQQGIVSARAGFARMLPATPEATEAHVAAGTYTTKSGKIIIGGIR